MAFRNDDERAVEEVTKDWMGINETSDAVEFKAWAEYRRCVFGCHFVPKNFTVPTAFPPSTLQAAKEYATAISLIRRSIKWSDARSAVPKNPEAWR